MLKNVYVVGTKQTIKAINNNLAKQCFVATDADENIKDQVIKTCSNKNIPLIYFDSMSELGKFCKISNRAASVVELNKI